MSLIETIIGIILLPFAMMAAYTAVCIIFAIVKKVIGR